MKNRKPKNCKNCNAVYTPTGNCQVFCSIECNIEYHRKTEAECIVCKKKKPYKSPSEYCSPECKISDNTKYINDCHIYTGKTDKDGYGIVYNNIKAHRFICESVHGPAPEDKPMTLHSCDNPSCCNPEHLRWGNAQENTNDKFERNRDNNPKGENVGTSKLTEERVIEIIGKLKNFKKGDYQKLSEEYNMGKTTIFNIHKNKSWKHIPR